MYEFKVVMTCEGCSGAVNRVLGRLTGKKNVTFSLPLLLVVVMMSVSEVTKVDIDMEGQRVFIESTLSGEELLATLKKTGRECSYIGVKQ